MESTSQTRYASLVLRVGLALVILWFGSNQLLHPDVWTSWVPEWTSALSLTPERVVFLNGLFEVLAGALLLVGVYTRLIAAVLFAHIALLVLEIGMTPVGVRDFGLSTGFLALALEQRHSWTLTKF